MCMFLHAEGSVKERTSDVIHLLSRKGSLENRSVGYLLCHISTLRGQCPSNELHDITTNPANTVPQLSDVRHHRQTSRHRSS